MLKIEHLQKHYQGFDLDCSLEILPGRITGLVGQNGAGKSTTIKAVLGLIRPDSGKITVLGKELCQTTAWDRQAFGVVLSDSGFSGYLTIRDIIPVLQGLYTHFDRVFFLAQAERFGLPLNKKIKEFSTGMKAKLKVLAAISHHARLLILDEPTAGLDVVAREELLELLRAHMEQNTDNAILVSSHISSDLESLCDDLYMIHDGHVLLHEDIDVLLSDYGLMKLDAQQYRRIDRQYILRTKQEPYGYCCLTNQRRFYLENAPDVTVERGSVDVVISMMIRGKAQ